MRFNGRMALKIDTNRLQAKLDKAIQKGKNQDALKILVDLEKADSRNPRWPRRSGDIFRRMKDMDKAAAAYERAVDRYAKKGFITHAVAMAKIVISVDPSREEILQQIDPSVAQELYRQSRPPAAPGNAEATNIVEEAKPLERAKDEETGEIRFEDAQEEETPLLDLSEEEVAMPELEPETEQAQEEEPSAESIAVLPLFPLFADIPKEALTTLATKSELIELEAEAKIVSCGDVADSLYAIVDGTVAIDVPEIPGRQDYLLGAGDMFGETCLLDEEKRVADVYANSELTALKIPKAVLEELVQEHPKVRVVLLNLLTRRLVANLLQSSELFSAFDTSTRQDLARMFEVRNAIAGTTIMESGMRSDGLYIPLTGHLMATISPMPKAIRVGPGSIVGAMSLLSQSPSEISVEAPVNMILLRLPASRFTDIAMQYPPALAHLADLAARLKGSVGTDRIVV